MPTTDLPAADPTAPLAAELARLADAHSPGWARVIFATYDAAGRTMVFAREGDPTPVPSECRPD